MTWMLGCVIVAVAVLTWWSRQRYRHDDMGYVSGQWLAEYRQDRNP
jgi:hypothetical protein